MSSFFKKLLQGDSEAVSAFYYKYSKQLLQFLKKKLPVDIAEEMLSDVFLEAIDSLPTLREENNLKAFVYKIAKHKIADYYRKRRLKTVLFSQIPFLEIMAAEIHEPEFQVEKMAVKEKFEKTLFTLSEKYRKVLVLFYVEQKSVKDIAVLFSLTPKATESLLYRARQSFMVAYERA